MEVRIEPAIKPKVCILGGTGFVGGHLAAQLVEHGFTVRIPTRRPVRHRSLGVLQGASVVTANIHEPGVLEDVLGGCDAVINLVAILNEGRRGDFKRVHVDLVDRLSEACRRSGVRRLLHMSAMNASPQAKSAYLRSKGEGEDRAHAAEDLQVTSFRPSVIFGPNDHLFNRFAALLRCAPMLPLACPGARLSPVFVGDVVHALRIALTNPDTAGQRYELCGPRVMTLEEIVRYAADVLQIDKPIVPLGNGLSKLQARVLGMLPGRPFTMDNYLSLSVDAVCRDGFPAVFGIQPQPVEAVIPMYLGEANQRTQLAEARRAARRSPN
ncbi:MAG: complex I NDUFA9 subunit family protein [Gammaproteobacteria bacterium]|nr:complex I NDUFA9 subunit family protein [Gammaproteobacteria bacterium]